MAVVLGQNQYGKAETRVVRVFRDTEPHEIVDYNVSVALRGDFTDVHLVGDNIKCLTTDATKNTVNAFAKEAGEAVREPESFGLALARHFVDDVPQVERARIQLECYPWDRLTHAGSAHPHAFARRGSYVRTATVTYDGDRAWIVSGVRDLIVLKTTDSEFHTFYEDRYTTLEPTHDRIMASSVTAQWLHTGEDIDWSTSFNGVLAAMTDTFAGHHSLALQQTMYAMGEAIIAEQPELAEVRFSMPNKHHFVIDLSPYGLENKNEVFHADDRPYGYIEGTVRRDDAPDPGPAAFDPGQGW
ncbi:MAG: urate oxidase [Pseudonocardiales bacterium]|jgi:urate oxidase|nr:urate oxidase [Pseudonocardiales bacterium]MDT7577627.1 urate oxidase [Pseudonocardiales bacterium]